MKDFLLELFDFNEATNIKLLGRIWELPDKSRATSLFSHLINSQNKWLARITVDDNALFLDWWKPEFVFSELEAEWKRSIQGWRNYLQPLSDERLKTEIEYTGLEGKRYAATPMDVCLQLNFHSIHHRAQVQSILREQGIQPDFVDYIATKYRKLD